MLLQKRSVVIVIYNSPSDVRVILYWHQIYALICMPLQAPGVYEAAWDLLKVVMLYGLIALN